jgi:hypothetical protein
MMGADGNTAATYLYGASRPKIPQSEFIDILVCNSFSQFDAQDKKGWTVLHRAAAWGTSTDVKKLIQMRASVDRRTYKLDWTPLFCAVAYNNLDTLQALLDVLSVSDVGDQRDARGWNLLHVAAGYGNIAAIPGLLERGVDIEALSKATSRFVPPAIRDRCVTPAEVARSCGEQTYVHWTAAVEAAGRNVDVRPDAVDWSLEYAGGRLGECECCDTWNGTT